MLRSLSFGIRNLLPKTFRSQAMSTDAVTAAKIQENLAPTSGFGLLVERNMKSVEVVPKWKQPEHQFFDFSLVTYNILASCYMTATHFPYCKLIDRATNIRNVKLFYELDQLNPDIICMQEVEQTNFDCELLPGMQSRGYEGIYLGKDGIGFEGVATFYRSSKFAMQDSFEVSMNRLAEEQCFMTSSHADPRVLGLMSDCKSLVTLLSPKVGGKTIQPLTICNNHLFWNWKRHDVQTMLAGLLCQKLHFELNERKMQHHPLVLCGDLNITPNSPAYKLLTENAWNRMEQLTASHGAVGFGDVLMSLPDMFPNAYYNPIAPLTSAYKLALGKESEFTNFTHKFVDTLDYVMYHNQADQQQQHLHLRTVLEMVSSRLLSFYQGCPNAMFPSDHLSLRCDFSLEYRK